MKLLIMSDLHVDRATFELKLKGLEFDAVVLAGDIIEPGLNVVRWATRASTFGTDKPIIFVPGNHEFYGTCREAALDSIRASAAGTNVQVLDRDELILPDPAGGCVRFLGCTLWTDFEIPLSASAGEPPETSVLLAAEYAQRVMNDFQFIDTMDKGTGARRRFRAADSLDQHHIDRAWLLAKLEEPQPPNVRTVVVTHHAPCVRSVPDKYLHRRATPAFASDLPPEFFSEADLWIHGHMHSNSDYQHLNTRVICNPRGYQMKDGSFENLFFNPRLVVEV